MALLDCGNNQLTAIPNWPSNLQKVYCDSNYITTLPESVKLLSDLYIFYAPHNCFNPIPIETEFEFGLPGSQYTTDPNRLDCTPNGLTAQQVDTESIYLSPNPATNSINLSPQIVNLSLINNQGIEVLNLSNQGGQTIDISTLPSGMYYYKVNQQINGKLIVE
jgi:hypothetical protein